MSLLRGLDLDRIVTAVEHVSDGLCRLADGVALLAETIENLQPPENEMP